MRQELQLIAGLGSGILLTGFCLLGYTEDWIAAGQWLIQAGLLWAYVCWCVWRNLPLNRAGEDTPLYANLGWGNRLTILRGGLIALTGGFLFQNQAEAVNVLLPALLYTVAAILDRLDGFVARRSKQVSLLGNELDISFDALGLVVAPLLAIGLGKIHASYLLLSMAYYVYRWGLRRRVKNGQPIHALPPNPLRRTLAGFQMGFVAVALWPFLNPALTVSTSIALMLPVLFGFAMDSLAVSGRLQPPDYHRLEAWSASFLQPGLRVLLALLLFLALLDAGRAEPSTWLLVFSACLIGLGLAARLAALILLLLLNGLYAGGPIGLSGHALIFTVSWLMLLGAGRHSLWQWDDEWVKRYDGA